MLANPPTEKVDKETQTPMKEEPDMPSAGVVDGSHASRAEQANLDGADGGRMEMSEKKLAEKALWAGDKDSQKPPIAIMPEASQTPNKTTPEKTWAGVVGGSHASRAEQENLPGDDGGWTMETPGKKLAKKAPLAGDKDPETSVSKSDDGALSRGYYFLLRDDEVEDDDEDDDEGVTGKGSLGLPYLCGGSGGGKAGCATGRKAREVAGKEKKEEQKRQNKEWSDSVILATVSDAKAAGVPEAAAAVVAEESDTESVIKEVIAEGSATKAVVPEVVDEVGEEVAVVKSGIGSGVSDVNDKTQQSSEAEALTEADVVSEKLRLASIGDDTGGGTDAVVPADERGGKPSIPTSASHCELTTMSDKIRGRGAQDEQPGVVSVAVKDKDVRYLCISAAARSRDFNAHLNSVAFIDIVKQHARSFSHKSVTKKTGEPFCKTLKRLVLLPLDLAACADDSTLRPSSFRRSPISPETIVVCEVRYAPAGEEEKDILSQLVSLFASVVNESGLLIFWNQQPGDFGATSTDLLFELAGAGLMPASGVTASSNCFNQDRFVLHFEKKEFLIRNPNQLDLDMLCDLEKESWKGQLGYPRGLIEQLTKNNPQDILLQADKGSGDIVGAMYTQRVKDAEGEGANPWRASTVKQFIRVSTRQGGASVEGSVYAPRTDLPDFALIVAKSQGAGQVVQIAPEDHEQAMPFFNRNCVDAGMFNGMVGKVRSKESGNSACNKAAHVPAEDSVSSFSVDDDSDSSYHDESIASAGSEGSGGDDAEDRLGGALPGVDTAPGAADHTAPAATEQSFSSCESVSKNSRCHQNAQAEDARAESEQQEERLVDVDRVGAEEKSAAEQATAEWAEAQMADAETAQAEAEREAERAKADGGAERDRAEAEQATVERDEAEDDGEQNAESDNAEPAAKRRRDQLAVEVARISAKKQGLVEEMSNLIHSLTVHRNALREGSNPLFAAKTHLNKLIWMKVDKLFDPKSPNLRGVIPLARNVLRIIAPLVQWSKVLGMYHCSRAEEHLELARQAMKEPDLGENNSFANNLLSLKPVAGEEDEREEDDTEETEIEVAVENLCAAISKQEGKRVSHTEVFDFLRLGWETRDLVYHLLHLCIMSKWSSMGTHHQLHSYSTTEKTEILKNRATSLFDRVVEMTGNNSIVFDDRTSILDFIESVILPAFGSVELHSLAAQVVIDARNSMTELSGKERDELFRGFFTLAQHDNGNGSGGDIPQTIQDDGGDYCGGKGKRNERDRMATLFCCLVAKSAIESQLPIGTFSKSGGFTETLLRLSPSYVAKKCRPLFLRPKFFECAHEEGSDVAEKVKKEIIKSKVADDSSSQRTIIVDSFQQISSLEKLTEL